ncbi:MAG: MerR family DNA-binding transcriptional regulator [Paracoccaceae bacterium]|nr:MerR family DNA-binding transcriptional regulator [Paracoccaceae bacterium]
MTDDLMTIREMCEAFDVTPRTLRFYEAKELLQPIREGQRRLYTRRERARLKLILRGRRFGFSLEEIRQLLELYDIDEKGETQLRAVYEAARARLADMVAQRDELTQAIAELEDQLAWGKSILDRMGQTDKAAE